MSACVVCVRSAAPAVYFFLALVCPRSSPMAPPRDTTGSAGAHKHFEPAEKPGRFNQKSTFRNGTTEEGWFYPTPAALKASADVRGARSAQEFFRPSRSDVPTRRQRRGLLPALPVRLELHVRHGAPRVRNAGAPLNLCSRSPRAARARVRGLRRTLRVPGGGAAFGARVLVIALAACNTLEYRSKRAESGKRDCWS